jgi:hypothetical protein
VTIKEDVVPNPTAAQIKKNSSKVPDGHREETNTTSESSSKDWWDKADVIGKIVGSLFIPVVVLFAGYLVNIALQKRADQQKTVELAITILQSDKADKTPELKKWALGVLETTATSASQTLPPLVVEELKKSPLPSAPVPSAHYDIKSSFPVVGSRFTPEQFQGYVSSLDFSSWKPQFVVLHSTREPDLVAWHKIPEPERLENLARLYGMQGFSGGPHLFVDDEGIWVFNPLTKPGVHSPSWNMQSIGVDMVGNFSTSQGNAVVLENAVKAIAIIDAALGVGAGTLKFHSEDPRSFHKDCPGTTIDKVDVIQRIGALLLSH